MSGITPLPTPPSTSDPSNFSTRADDFLAALPTFATEANDLAAALNNISTTSTSVTSNTIGTGSKAFTVETGKSYFPGQSLNIASTSAPTNRMFAAVDSYDSGTGALVVTSQAFEGSGTFTDWTITLGFNGVVQKSQLADDAKTDKIQPITASVASNALTITLNPTTLDFRSSTLGSGTVNTRIISSPISVVVSSGSTLGTVNGVQSRLAVLAIDNAGTVELAVVNLAGGVNLDETGVISTTAEGGAGAADSATVVYSTTARTNVPYRVVGFVESTQATAGTWATAPSLIQGYGGQAFAAMSSLGYGQTWQNLTGSRALSTTYYNTTGRPIKVAVRSTTVNAGVSVTFLINGGAVQYHVVGGAETKGFTVSEIVPPGASYSVAMTSAAIQTWFELR